MGAGARSLLLPIVCCSIVLPCAANAQSPNAHFVDAAQVVPGLVLEIRYFGENNFVGRRIDGYEAPICLLTREAAAALANVQRDLAVNGLGVKVFDCYRPVRAVAHFLRWARDHSDQQRKPEFYPEFDKRDLFRDGYISARSGHSRGSTIDVTLITLSDRQQLDMGSPFDFFGARSARSDRTVSAEARANRDRLAAAMARRGFRGYWKEWWHFTLAGEPFPDTYFDFPVR
jgi:D-alanyl-D-alanine dipeptidase